MGYQIQRQINNNNVRWGKELRSRALFLPPWSNEFQASMKILPLTEVAAVYERLAPF